MVNNLSKELARLLGLTDYEARAYLGLLRTGPATGYAAAKAFGIPTSKSYEAVEGLARKGGAVTFPGDPLRYAAVAPDILLDQMRRKHAADLERLGESLAAIADSVHRDELLPLWHSGAEPGLSQSAQRIGAAHRSIIGALPSAARDALESALGEAAQRGVLVQIVSSGDDLMTVLIDDREAIVGVFSDEAEVIGSGNTAVIALCRIRLRAASSSPFLRPSEDVAEWLRWEEQKGLRLLKTGR